MFHFKNLTKQSTMHRIIRTLFCTAHKSMRDRVEGLELLRRVTGSEVYAAWTNDALFHPDGNEEVVAVQIIQRVLRVLKSLTVGSKEIENSLFSLLHIQTIANSIEIGNASPYVYNVVLGWFIKAVAGEPPSMLSNFVDLKLSYVLEEKSIKMSMTNLIMLESLQGVARKAYEWLFARRFIRGRQPLSSSEVQVHVALVGPAGSGKSSLFHRLVHRSFPAAHLQLNACVDCCTYAVDNLLGDMKIKVVVTDATSILSETVLRKVDGVFVMYDVSCRNSDAVTATKLLTDLSRKSSRNVPVVVFGNKCDITRRKCELKCTDGLSHYIGSALTGENVYEAMNRLVYETTLVKYQRRSLAWSASATDNVSIVSSINENNSKVGGRSSIFSWYKLLL